MQTVPGYIDSMTDFYVTSAGLGVTETTIAGFVGYDVNGIPEYVRSRKATQYANSIDEWVDIENQGNNGGYANIWLLADTKNGEIARYEQGLTHRGIPARCAPDGVSRLVPQRTSNPCRAFRASCRHITAGGIPLCSVWAFGVCRPRRVYCRGQRAAYWAGGCGPTGYGRWGSFVG